LSVDDYPDSYPYFRSKIMQRLLLGTAFFLMVLARPVQAQESLPYTAYTSFDQVLEGRKARYPAMIRVSDPGTKERPIYTGFFFYQCLQFDKTGRYLLGMRVYFEYRSIKPSDRGDVGFIDLKDRNKWTKIGETTAWSWQQGPRLQWRPRSDEIVWNDRADDGKKFTPSPQMARMFAIFIIIQATMRGWMTTTSLILVVTSLPAAIRPFVDIFSSKTMAVELQRNFSGR
jgi:hypothetical protein